MRAAKGQAAPGGVVGTLTFVSRSEPWERTKVRPRRHLRSFLGSGAYNVPVHHLRGVYGRVLAGLWFMLPPSAVGPLFIVV